MGRPLRVWVAAGAAIAAALSSCARPGPTPEEAERISGELSRLLPELRVGVSGSKAVVEGEIHSFEAYARVHPVLYDSQYADRILNRVFVTEKAWQRVAERITAEIRPFAPRIRARAVNRQIWLEGEAASDEDARRAQKVANLMLPEAIPPDPVAAHDPRGEVLKVPPRATVQNFVVIRPKSR